MTCPNCKGKRVFKGPSTCPFCSGSGRVPDVYRLTFVNQENGKTFRYVLDGRNPPPLKLDEQVVHRHGTDIVVRQWLLPLEDIFSDMCTKLGVSEQTHCMYHSGKPIEFGWGFGPVRIFSTGQTMSSDPAVEELKKRTREAIGRKFAWYVREKKRSALVWVFRPRRPTGQLLEDLWQILSSRGYAYVVLVSEGNIATGERGYGIFLASSDGAVWYGEIGLAYTLSVALQQAWENAGEAMDRADTLRENE